MIIGSVDKTAETQAIVVLTRFSILSEIQVCGFLILQNQTIIKSV